MRTAFTVLTFIVACTGSSLAQTRTAFSIDELVADAPAYVAARYQASELPAALIADLTSAGFTCQHGATGSECTRSVEANGSCFDVTNVSIGAESVLASRNVLCMGAEE